MTTTMTTAATLDTRRARAGAELRNMEFMQFHPTALALSGAPRLLISEAMRGEGAPSPIYEGEDSVIAWMLNGPQAHYVVPLPAQGEAKRAIMDSYTKEHSAEYQSQALIDLDRGRLFLRAWPGQAQQPYIGLGPIPLADPGRNARFPALQGLTAERVDGRLQEGVEHGGRRGR